MWAASTASRTATRGRVTRRSAERNCSAKSDPEGTPLDPVAFLESVKFFCWVGCHIVPLNTVAVEMVPPNAGRSLSDQLDEARKVARISAELGIAERSVTS